MIHPKMDLKDVDDHPDYFRLPAGTERSSTTSSSGKATLESGVGGMKTVADEELEEEKNRGTWSNQCQFILTSLGLAVGLGNIWRFPAVAYEHGGSAFIIPYVICLVTFGLPMVYLEFYMGQHVRAAPALLFRRYAPILQGFGWGPAISAAGVCVYYTIVIGWAALYLVSIGDMDQWTTCRNESKYCVSKARTWHENCTDGETFFNKTCVLNNSTELEEWRISAPEDYYQREIMGKSEGNHPWHFDNFNWKMAITLTILWILIWLILVKGVKIMGYLSYVIVTLPYISVAALFINGLTLDGAMDGLDFYWGKPKFEKLIHASTWTAALNQLCFSLSVGYGGLMVLASYCKKDNNCFRNAIILCVGDTVMSVIGGGAMFSTLGYLAHETGVPKNKFDSVVQSGTGLAFVTIPQAISNMPAAGLWAAVFFIMIMSLGISTEVALVEVTCSCIYDLYPKTRNYKWMISFIICIVLYALGMTMMWGNGIFFFTIMNEYIGTSGTVLVVASQAITVSYFYGYKNANTDIKEIFGEPRNAFTKYVGPTSRYWQLNWMSLSPALAIFICGLLFIGKPPTYGKGAYEFHFPATMIALGWFLALSPLLLVIPYAVFNVIKTVRDGKPFMDVFRVQPDHPSYNRIHGLTAHAAQTRDEKFTKDTQEGATAGGGTQETVDPTRSAATTTRQDKSVEETPAKKTTED